MPSSYYPVFLDLRGRRCVVIGGGEVANRKVQGLLECSADVTLISPDLIQGLQALVEDGRIRWVPRRYCPGDLKEAFLAIAATDIREVNQAVSAEAAEERVALNVVDDTPLCSFIAPSVVKRGAVTVAISTGGSSPALARRLREALESSDLLRYADLADILSQARAKLKQQGLVVEPDRWQECITLDLVALVEAGKSLEALDQLMGHLLSVAEGATINVPMPQATELRS